MIRLLLALLLLPSLAWAGITSTNTDPTPQGVITVSPVTNQTTVTGSPVGLGGTVVIGASQCIGSPCSPVWQTIGLDLLAGTGNRCVYTDSLGILHAKADDCGASSPTGDNLGNHVMLQNLQTSGYWISRGASNAGIFLDASSNVSFAGPRPWLDVTSPAYGADPTGTSDATSAFVAAHTDCPSTGCTIFVPDGIYKFNQTSAASQFTISKSNVTLLCSGWGAQLKKTNTGVVTGNQGIIQVVPTSGGTVSNTQIKNCRVTGPTPATGGAITADTRVLGLLIGALSVGSIVQDTLVENMLIEQMETCAFCWVGDVRRLKLIGNWAYNGRQDGFNDFGAGTDITLENNYATYLDGFGFEGGTAGGLTLRGNYIRHVGQGGIGLEYNADSPGARTLIIGNYIEDVSTAAYPANPGIQLGHSVSARNTEIIGNSIFRVGGNGIEIIGASRELSIIGNTIHDVGGGANTSFESGILLTSVTDVHIASNSIWCCSTGYAMRIGIDAPGTHVNLRLEANQIVGASVAAQPVSNDANGIYVAQDVGITNSPQFPRLGLGTAAHATYSLTTTNDVNVAVAQMYRIGSNFAHDKQNVYVGYGQSNGINSVKLYNDTSVKWSLVQRGDASNVLQLTDSAGTQLLGFTQAGGVQLGSPIGADLGVGKLNVSGGLYVNAVGVATWAGSAPQIAFGVGSGLTGDSNFLWNSTTHRLSIAAGASPDLSVHLIANQSTGDGLIIQGGASNFRPTLFLRSFGAPVEQSWGLRVTGHQNGQLVFVNQTDGTDPFAFTKDGRFGLGFTNPTARIHLVNETSDTSMLVTKPGGATWWTLDNTPRQTINVTNTSPSSTTTAPLTIATTNSGTRLAVLPGVFSNSFMGMYVENDDASSTLVTVSSLTCSGSTATATTATPHGAATGSIQLMSGASPSGYNGSYGVTKISATVFTYTMTCVSSPATGSITAEGVSYGDRGSVTALFHGYETSAFGGNAIALAGLQQINGSTSPAERAGVFGAAFYNAGAGASAYGVNGFVGVLSGVTMAGGFGMSGLFELNCQPAECATRGFGVVIQNINSPFGVTVASAAGLFVQSATDAAGTIPAWVDAIRVAPTYLSTASVFKVAVDGVTKIGTGTPSPGFTHQLFVGNDSGGDAYSLGLFRLVTNGADTAALSAQIAYSGTTGPGIGVDVVAFRTGGTRATNFSGVAVEMSSSVGGGSPSADFGILVNQNQVEGNEQLYAGVQVSSVAGGAGWLYGFHYQSFGSVHFYAGSDGSVNARTGYRVAGGAVGFTGTVSCGTSNLTYSGGILINKGACP